MISKGWNNPVLFFYAGGEIKITILLKDLSLKDITAPVLLDDAQIKSIIPALDIQLRAITEQIPESALLANIEKLNTRMLNLLAWQFHADFYDLAVTDTLKQEHVRNALLLHMKKGTVWAIKEALRQLDIQAEFVPWWESGDKPYTFKLKAIVGGEYYRNAGRDRLTRNIRRAISTAKSARSYMTKLETLIPDYQVQNVYTALPTLIDGEELIRIRHKESAEQNIFAGLHLSAYYSIEIGVGLKTMHELLLRFEQRIFGRLDKHEQEVRNEINAMSDMLDGRLKVIEDLLKWGKP